MAAVNLWQCKPGTDDACLTGDDDVPLIKALVVAYSDQELAKHFGPRGWPRTGELWVQVLDDKRNEVYVRQVRKRSTRPVDDLDRSEFAMQQGMAFGCDAYNEAMGYYLSCPEEEP